jgi:spermidine synthase
LTRWFEETLHAGFRNKLAITEILHETKTDHQHLIIFVNPEFGRVLALDGVVQTTERDEFIYHEMLAHTPILAHGGAAEVLIVGGGDGGMLEEVLKHRGVTQVTLVEIDRTVIELSKTHLRSICGDAYEDPRTRVVIADGIDYVHETSDRFDVIIVDSTDPIGPGEVLFGEHFYEGCRRALNPGGILVTQNGVPFVQGGELRASLAILRRLFRDASCYRAAVPTYIGGEMTFGWAADDATRREVPLEALTERFAAAGIETRCYTPAVHKAAFALPPYIEALIS